jgi:CRISPR system Cascade subunit CasE
MKYLTQGIVGLLDAQKMRLRDSYDWHKFSWTAFPQKKPDDRRDFLTRIDIRDAEVKLLILSEQEPSQPISWPSCASWKTKVVGDEFLSHTNYLFNLRACPAKRDKSSGRRVPLTDEESAVAWILRKGSESGFSVHLPSLSIDNGRHDRFRIDRRGEWGSHFSVDYSAVLTVTDRAAFIDAFNKGIGSAKSFGYGMLMLSPV